MIRTRLGNPDIADALERVGDILEAQHANQYRVRAYHRAAETLRSSNRSVGQILDAEGIPGLEAIAGIGTSLASSIEELAFTGRLVLLERLEGQASPEDLFTTVPGIGEELAGRIHRVLHLDTLEELELAASDGRLETVPGFGPRRARAVREILAAMLARSTRRRARRERLWENHASPGTPKGLGDAGPAVTLPSVAVLLDVDREYRERAGRGELRLIRPRRFNPRQEAWLPILHTERQGWWFTALYSNTRRAHEMGRTRDWVVLFFEWDGHEDQCTVVTEYRGELAGRRVIRGRELECYDCYYPWKGGEVGAPDSAQL